MLDPNNLYSIAKMECIRMYKKAFLNYTLATTALVQDFKLTESELLSIQQVALDEQRKDSKNTPIN